MKPATKAIQFLEALAIPEGPKTGQLIKLAQFQKKFVKGVPSMRPRHLDATEISKGYQK
jgi:hypothetical protein